MNHFLTVKPLVTPIAHTHHLNKTNLVNNSNAQTKRTLIFLLFSFKSWTVDFCKSDTDGDKKTNGDELGDPCCEWNYGDASFPRVSAISHPAEPTSVTSAPSCSLEGVPSAPSIVSSHVGTSQLTLDFKTTSCVCSYKVKISQILKCSKNRLWSTKVKL